MNDIYVWQPISESKLNELIQEDTALMKPDLLAFWHEIRVRPVKWALHPIGDLGGGFWVVAVIGQQCVWFNDIEDGFNISRFAAFGDIGEEFCNQDELSMCVHRLFYKLPDYNLGPARPIEDI